MDKKLFIFDLDGTLVNTVVDLNNGINYALNKNGYPSKSVDHTAHAIGNGIFITILRSLPTKDEEATRICLKDFREFYRNLKVICFIENDIVEHCLRSRPIN